MAACQSCGAVVVWAVTAAGRRMPVDIEPAPNGNLLLDRSTLPVTVAAVGAGSDAAAGAPRYLSHFVTCPQAEDWRR